VAAVYGNEGWPEIQRVCPGTKQVQGSHASWGSSSTVLTSTTQEKAEVLSSFFSSVFTTEPPGDFVGINPRSIKQRMIDSFSEQLVEAKLTKLKINKSTGPDHMHPRVLKELGGVISLPLGLIFQTSFTVAARGQGAPGQMTWLKGFRPGCHFFLLKEI